MVLSKYLEKCLELYAVAFFQWRSIYPSYIKSNNVEELEEIISERITRLE